MTDPAAVKLGRKGGKAGKGASKRRGDSEYYRKLVAKRKDRQSKRKFGVWLKNNTDHRDDEWVYVMARNEDEAERLAEYDHSRFRISDVAPVKEFRKRHGLGNL